MPAALIIAICIAAAVAVLTVILLFVLTATAHTDDALKRRLRPFMGKSFAHKGLYLKDQTVPENSLFI